MEFLSVTIRLKMKATDQFFLVVLLIYNYAVHGGFTGVHVTYETVDEILKCDHSNESY